MTAQALLLVGTAITVVGAFVGGGVVLWSHALKGRETAAKGAAATARETAATARETAANQRDEELARQIAKGIKDQEQRDREHRQLSEQLIAIQAAAADVKAEYERRIKILDAIRMDNANRGGVDGSTNVPSGFSDTLKQAFATVPGAVEERLRRQQLAAKIENEILQRALDEDEKVRPRLRTFLFAMKAAIEAAAKDGWITLKSPVVTSPLPDRTMFAWGEPSGNERVLHAEFAIDPPLDIVVYPGKCRSAEYSNSSTRDPNIYFPSLKAGDVTLIRFDRFGKLAPYSSGESAVIETNSSDEEFAGKVMAALLVRLQVENAVKAKKQP